MTLFPTVCIPQFCFATMTANMLASLSLSDAELQGKHCLKIVTAQKHILKSGKKLVATKLYENDAYMIHFQTYGC